MINFQFEPFSIRLSKTDGYGLSILGFTFNNKQRAIGFNFYKNKKIDSVDNMFVFYIYGFIRRIVLKTTKQNHYICNYCKTPVTNYSKYCTRCGETMLDNEITLIGFE